MERETKNTRKNSEIKFELFDGAKKKWKFTVYVVVMSSLPCSFCDNAVVGIHIFRRCSCSGHVVNAANETTYHSNRALIHCDCRFCSHHVHFLTKSFVNDNFLKLNDGLDLIKFFFFFFKFSVGCCCCCF